MIAHLELVRLKHVADMRRGQRGGCCREQFFEFVSKAIAKPAMDGNTKSLFTSLPDGSGQEIGECATQHALPAGTMAMPRTREGES